MISRILEDLLDCEAVMNVANALPSDTPERYAAWADVDAYCTSFISDHLPELRQLLGGEPRYTITPAGREHLDGKPQLVAESGDGEEVELCPEHGAGYSRDCAHCASDLDALGKW